MSTRSQRRDALVLGASMAAAAALAGVGRLALKPEPAASASGPPVDLATLVPRRFEGWQEDPASEAVVRPPELQGKVYGLYDQVLERTFIGTAGRRMMLSMAFGADQSTSFQLHRPEVCYEAAGFEVTGLQAGAIDLAGRSVPVTRLLAFKPDRPEPITYWTVLDGELVGGRLGFRFRRLLSGLQRRTISGLLVRMSSIDEDTARAYALQASFAEAMAAALDSQGQETVLGHRA